MLTIEDDVAAELERLLRERNSSLGALVNEALRRRLRDMQGRPKRGKPFRTATYDLGASRLK